MVRTCRKCGSVLPLDAFPFTTKNHDKRENVCRECRKEYWRNLKAQGRIGARARQAMAGKTERTCEKCGRTLPLEQFPFYMKGLRRGVCADCRNASRRQHSNASRRQHSKEKKTEPKAEAKRTRQTAGPAKRAKAAPKPSDKRPWWDHTGRNHKEPTRAEIIAGSIQAWRIYARALCSELNGQPRTRLERSAICKEIAVCLAREERLRAIAQRMEQTRCS